MANRVRKIFGGTGGTTTATATAIGLSQARSTAIVEGPVG